MILTEGFAELLVCCRPVVFQQWGLMLQKAGEGEEAAKPLPLVDCLKTLAAAWESVDEASSRLHLGDYCTHVAMGLNPGMHAWS